MPRRRALSFAFAIVLLASLPADGREVVLGLEQSITADSNLFNSSTNPTADGSYRVGPTVRLSEDRDVINYDFFYTPQYQVYMRTDDINGWNQTFIGKLDYNPTARDQISLESSAVLRSAVALVTDPGLAPGSASVPGIGDTGRYTVDLSYRRRFTERVTSTVSGGYEQWTYTNLLASPNISGSGKVSGMWAITPEIRAGLDVEGTYRRFEAVGPRPQSSNVVANTSLFASWKIDERWSVVASGGPTYVAQRQDAPDARTVQRFAAFQAGPQVFAAQFVNCTPLNGTLLLANCGIDVQDPSNGLVDPFQEVVRDFPPGEETTSTNASYPTFFANAGVTYALARGSLNLGYSRNQDASGGVGATNIVDALNFTASYYPIRHWTIGLSANWSVRNSRAKNSQGFVTALPSTETSDGGEPLAQAGPLTLVNFDSTQRINAGRVILTGTHQLNENLKLTGQFSYLGQSFESSFTNPGGSISASTSSRRFNRYIGRVIVRYEFDPFRF